MVFFFVVVVDGLVGAGLVDGAGVVVWGAANTAVERARQRVAKRAVLRTVGFSLIGPKIIFVPRRMIVHSLCQAKSQSRKSS